MFEPWQLDQVNLITFVLIDGTGTEITGLAGTYTMELSKNGCVRAQCWC
jgi:hypothetical protein